MSEPANAIETRSLRASSKYELVLFDRLTDHERAALGDLRRQRDFYGILRPRGEADAPQLPMRAVDRETALLILTLQAPGRIPAYALDADPSGQSVVQLVLDGVLEIDDGGDYVAGPRAAHLLRRAPEPVGGQTRLARISGEAIACAATLDIDDRDALARWLYSYNRMPVSAAHTRTYPDAASILALVADDDTLRTNGWRVTGGSRGDWISLAQSGGSYRSHPRTSRGDGPTYKLYVSPSTPALADACRELRRTLEEHHVRNFKLAGSATGLLRPDKLVAYFNDPATLMSVADVLADRLRGAPAQGVPFTASIDADGLLSWGVDPPAGDRPLSWQREQSWRSWVTSTLAGALLQARDTPGTTSPGQFAIERLGLEGVDVDRWAPGQRLWRDPQPHLA
jgi:hypothetical protein